MTVPLVELRGIAKRFESLAQATAVLDGIDLKIDAGESVAVVGPSGCGKSTLLNIIGALLPSSAGEVLFDGEALSSMDPDSLAGLRNREIGYVFQQHHLLPQCTALENVLIPTLVQGSRTDRDKAHARARELLDAVGLG